MAERFSGIARNGAADRVGMEREPSKIAKTRTRFDGLIVSKKRVRGKRSAWL